MIKNQGTKNLSVELLKTGQNTKSNNSIESVYLHKIAERFLGKCHPLCRPPQAKLGCRDCVK